MMLCYTRTQRQKFASHAAGVSAVRDHADGGEMTGADDHDGIQHPLSAFRQRTRAATVMPLPPSARDARSDHESGGGQQQHKGLTTQTSSRGVAQTFLFFAATQLGLATGPGSGTTADGCHNGTVINKLAPCDWPRFDRGAPSAAGATGGSLYLIYRCGALL